MARHWFAKAAVLMLAVSVVLAGCGGTKDSGSGTKYKVGMVTDVGGLNDDSFNASSWDGLEKAKKDLGIEIKAVESKKDADYEPNFRTLLDQKFDLIWGIGFLMGDAITKAAKENPNSKWAIIDAEVAAPNVASVTFKEEEGSFLMGVIAAKTTKTKKVGFVGGMNIPVIEHFDGGFYAGVKAVDPSIEVIRVYSGTFTDSAKGKADALSIYAKGADVIFHAAGATGQGVIEAAAAQKKYVIGVDKDQNSLAPEYVISSMMKRVDEAIYQVSKQAKEGKFPGGTIVKLGLKENGVGYAPKTLWKVIPAGTQKLVDDYAKAIKDGKFVVPDSFAKAEKFQTPKL